MRLIGGLVLIAAVLFQPQAYAWEDTAGWRRVNSRYCTLWLDAGVDVEKVNRKIGVRRIRSEFKVSRDASAEVELADKCDILFRRAQEVLDMYPAGLHVSIKVKQDLEDIRRVHEQTYGHGTDAIAIYLFQENTIYAAAGEVSVIFNPLFAISRA